MKPGRSPYSKTNPKRLHWDDLSGYENPNFTHQTVTLPSQCQPLTCMAATSSTAVRKDAMGQVRVIPDISTNLFRLRLPERVNTSMTSCLDPLP